MRGSEHEATLNHIFRQALASSDELESSSEEDCESFKMGMQKLLNELKYAQIETLKQKSRQNGLNENEKKLLLAFINAGCQAFKTGRLNRNPYRLLHRASSCTHRRTPHYVSFRRHRLKMPERITLQPFDYSRHL